MTDPWRPTQIVPPSLVVDLAHSLYQYAVTLSSPETSRGATGEELVGEWTPVHEHIPAMISKAAIGGGVEQRSIGDVTVEQSLVQISLGGLFPDVEETWKVTDELSGTNYDIVGVDHPVGLMTIITAMARSPE